MSCISRGRRGRGYAGGPLSEEGELWLDQSMTHKQKAGRSRGRCYAALHATCTASGSRMCAPRLSASPPTPQHGAPSAEPPRLALRATRTRAQQGGPASWEASADKHCIASATELKQRTREHRPRSLFNILQVISLWCAGGGGRRERKLENHHYVGRWLSINKVRGIIKQDLTVLCPHSPGVYFLGFKRQGGHQEGPSSLGVGQQDSHLHHPFLQVVTHKRWRG